jgi:hypothetical protein
VASAARQAGSPAPAPASPLSHCEARTQPVIPRAAHHLSLRGPHITSHCEGRRPEAIPPPTKHEIATRAQGPLAMTTPLQSLRGSTPLVIARAARPEAIPPQLAMTTQQRTARTPREGNAGRPSIWLPGGGEFTSPFFFLWPSLTEAFAIRPLELRLLSPDGLRPSGSPERALQVG